MKFSPKTVEILKNFATINPGLYFKKGNVVSTMSPQKNILCEATVEDEFPQDFGIHELNSLLSILTLNKDPEIEFDDKHIYIKFLNGRSKFKWRTAEPSMIISPPEKKLTLPTVDVTFTLSEEDLAWIQKTASILRSPHVAVASDRGVVSIVCYDATNDAAPTNSLDLDISSDSRFKMIFNTENLKLIPGGYTFEISQKGIAHLTSNKESIQYWIAIEAGSIFEA